jgi:hypothetical protein
MSVVQLEEFANIGYCLNFCILNIIRSKHTMLKPLYLVFFVAATTHSVFAQDKSILLHEQAGLTITIEMNDVPQQQSVWLNYEIVNETDSVISFPYSFHWDFPIGMTGVVTKKNGKSLVRVASRHVLADELVQRTDLQQDQIDLDPGDRLNGIVNLLNIVILKDQFGVANLSPGKYVIGLTFFGNKSNMIDLIIPKE